MPKRKYITKGLIWGAILGFIVTAILFNFPPTENVYTEYTVIDKEMDSLKWLFLLFFIFFLPFAIGGLAVGAWLGAYREGREKAKDKSEFKNKQAVEKLEGDQRKELLGLIRKQKYFCLFIVVAPFIAAPIELIENGIVKSISVLVLIGAGIWFFKNVTLPIRAKQFELGARGLSIFALMNKKDLIISLGGTAFIFLAVVSLVFTSVVSSDPLIPLVRENPMIIAGLVFGMFVYLGITSWLGLNKVENKLKRS